MCRNKASNLTLLNLKLQSHFVACIRKISCHPDISYPDNCYFDDSSIVSGPGPDSDWTPYDGDYSFYPLLSTFVRSPDLETAKKTVPRSPTRGQELDIWTGVCI